MKRAVNSLTQTLSSPGVIAFSLPTSSCCCAQCFSARAHPHRGSKQLILDLFYTDTCTHTCTHAHMHTHTCACMYTHTNTITMICHYCRNKNNEQLSSFPGQQRSSPRAFWTTSLPVPTSTPAPGASGQLNLYLPAKHLITTHVSLLMSLSLESHRGFHRGNGDRSSSWGVGSRESGKCQTQPGPSKPKLQICNL